MEVDECDGEVEFLEEDADIVQRYVSKPITKVASEPDPRLEVIFTTDANYFQTGKRSNPRGRRGRKRNTDTDEEYKPETEIIKKKPRKEIKKKVISSYKKREKSIIPDYGDTMFLPVNCKMIPRNLENITKINKWNDFCIEQYKKADELLYNSDSDDVTIDSKRTLVFRQIKNRITGKREPVISGKTQISLSSGKQKTSNYQCVLPNFFDKLNLEYKVYPPRITGQMVLFQHTDLLNCEKRNGQDVLVCYTPKDRSSIIYKLVDKRKSPESSFIERQLEEQSCMNVCAPCYQHSNRGSGYLPQKKNIVCVMCGINFSNTYTMLKHLKTHDNKSLQNKKELISDSLANLVGYHYKCRICQQRFNTIKELKRHVTTHQGKTLFKCDVGNHVTQ